VSCHGLQVRLLGPLAADAASAAAAAAAAICSDPDLKSLCSQPHHAVKHVILRILSNTAAALFASAINAETM
jgi:hypothetical protein